MDFETEIMDTIDNLNRLRTEIGRDKCYQYITNAIMELRYALGELRMPKDFVQSSREPIKSSHDRETLKKVIRAYLDKMGYKDVEGGVDAAADYILQNEEYYPDYDLHLKVKQWFKETKENYPETLIKASKTIKSDFDDYGNWVDDEKPVKKEDMHGSFRKLSKEEHDELKPQVEEELDRWMSRKHFGLDKEVYDETVEYIISLFGEDNYAPKDVKEAVSSWYNDTLDSFPEMLKGKGDKRKIASAAYLKQIKSSHCIK